MSEKRSHNPYDLKQRVADLEHELASLREKNKGTSEQSELSELVRDARRFEALFECDLTHLYSDYWTQKLNAPDSPPSASEAAFLAATDHAIEGGAVIETHECHESKTCACSMAGLEPNETCPQHGGGEWPPRCEGCGRFMLRKP